MNSDLVSIIIPTYNRAHLVADTLDSIQNQTHKNWECIVVDDGSTDGTELLINTYVKNDKRFVYVKRPDTLPKGANACRNHGFSLSKGQFINWFDSDDIMHVNKLKVQIQSLNNNPNVPYTICQSKWFDKEINKDLGLRSKTVDSEKRLEDYCLYNIVWLTTAPLWRRSFIIDNQLHFDETLHQSQEYDFHVKALSISDKYAITNEPLLTLVKHHNAISSNIFEDSKIESNLKVKRKVTDNNLSNFTSQGKLKWLEIVTLFYKDLLLHKKYKFSSRAIAIIFWSVKEVDVPVIRKIVFKFRILIMFVSFAFSGKGYNLVKPLK